MMKVQLMLVEIAERPKKALELLHLYSYFQIVPGVGHLC